MLDQTIRIGVIGAGKNTVDKHIPGFQALEGVEVVGVCNRTRDSAEAVAERFGIPRVLENWWDVVNSPDTDAIMIGTWPYMHHPITLAAFEAGKHVLCEARMAMNYQEAKDMLMVSRRNPHLVAQVVPSPFTLAVDGVVQRLIAEDYLGEILAIEVRAVNNGAFMNSGAALHWRQDFDLSGFNIMSLGIWYEALMRWVGEAASVVAMGKTYTKMRPDRDTGVKKAVVIPEHLNVVADMNCGAQASFLVSSVAGLGGRDGALLFGSDGALRFSDGKLYGGRRGESKLSEISIAPEEQGGWRVEEEFINAIRGLEPVTHTTFEDGAKYMAFTEAVTRSMVERRQVAISELR